MKYHNSLITIAKVKKTKRKFAAEDVELEISCILVRMRNCSASLESRLSVFCKTKHTVTIHFSNSSAKYLQKRNENMCLKYVFYTNAHSTFVPNSQNQKHSKCFLETQTP